MSTFCDPCYLLGVYLRCLLCVLLLSVEIEVSTFNGPYYRLGVYFLWSVLSTRCLLSVSTVRASTFRLPSRSRCLLSVVRRLPTWCLLSVIRTIYSVYTFGVYFACFYFPSRSRCLLSMVRTTDSVSTFYGLYYLRGVYFRCLLCVLLLSVFRRDRGVYFRWSVDYLLGVYFL